ncbi:hypothetical protein FRC11_004837 [Ceratobasidium sp. 423]|nr:hypothetical protein FRC11_004837 [Ceratobasidium sp. 423]
MTHTRHQKRQLEDPGDISITRAPQAPKKTRQKAIAAGTKDSTTPASNTILPASITTPTPEDLTLMPAGNISDHTGVEPTTASKIKPPTKKKGKKVATATTLAETPQEPQANTTPEAAPTNDGQASGKRKKTPSAVAQKAAAQKEIDQEKKAAKAKKKEKKAASTVIDESPEATRAFLERMKASTTNTLAVPATTPSESIVTQSASSAITESMTSRRNNAHPDKRKALNHLIQAHQPPTSVGSTVSVSSSFASLTPSESVSQGGPAAPTLEPLPRSKPKSKSKQKTKASTPSLLGVPASNASSRDTSPLPEQLADGDLAEYGSDLEIDPATILDGIPKHLAPVLEMPEPLSGPLHIPERMVPLEPIDLTAFSATERTKIKAKRELKIKHLKPIDRAVVSSALSRMGALLVVVCGFPDEDTAWLLACNANHWASKKHGRNLKLVKGSEYAKLLYDRIPMMRTGLVAEKKRTEVALTYELKAANIPNAIKENRKKVKCLLDGANFTCPVEKVLAAYKSGTHVDNSFNANDFTPVYFSHLATLAAIYKTPEAQEKLVGHLQRVADELREPFMGAIRAQGIQHVRSRVPQALIAARYRSSNLGTSAPANIDPRNRQSRKKPVSDSSQELVCNVQMRLGPLLRSVSASSAPESDVIDAIHGSTQAGPSRNLSAEDYTSFLHQVTGSSDSEIQAIRAGVLEVNQAQDPMHVEQPDSGDSDDSDDSDDSGDDGATRLPSPATVGRDVSGGDGFSQGQDESSVQPTTQHTKPSTLSSDESGSSDEESDGEGMAGLVPTTQNPGDVTMRSAAALSDNDEEDEDEDEEGEAEGDDKATAD